MSDQPLPLNAFADCLRAARAARGLSVRELEKESGISFSLISALENRRRSAGPDTLKKLAAALRLRGTERDLFLKLGGDTSCRHRVQVNEKRKGMQLLRDLVGVLAGVERDDIEDIIVEYHVPTGRAVYDFVVRLRDGKLLAGEIKHDEIWIIPSQEIGMLPDHRPNHRTAATRVIKIPKSK